MSGTLRFLLGDQLTRGLTAFDGLDRDTDVVLMVEVDEEATYVRHHKQKIVFLLSAMRHFAAELQAEGIAVDYVRLDDPANGGSFGAELERAIARHAPARIVMTEPGEWRVREMMETWRDGLAVPLEILPDTRFLASHDDFAAWAGTKRQLRMEYFYRTLRRRTGLLMDGEEPAGGRWNFDPENRRRLPDNLPLPARLRFAPDGVTREVMALVEARYGNHFGTLEGFGWAVTRADALEALDDFITTALPRFGDYQDAMKAGEDFLFHGLLSPYLNAGLLTPLEVCLRAETAYRAGAAPLNAVEGFIRQILGWREFVRGLYWHDMPAYGDTNHLNAQRDLPDFYWTGETEMACLRAVVDVTRRTAYAHHIQRLMVTGNFALLAGVAPRQIEAWYLAVYVDAFEWVELPNVHGMVMHADGGRLGSKPYAASGAYIKRMSDYCRGCAYDPDIKEGPGACPFNHLYWSFLMDNADALAGNPRMAMPYRTLERMVPERRARLKAEADAFLNGLPATGRWS
ncbi:cryptochrome/photolyase family protein [Aquabacter sp. P-9]|uniref:cryptochrome/photolyase family protein n=1 Tax=Aquabacter sediminis TaxID=3029197 RepID=UPI00237E0AB5|nr:cryptochrome/photolyase family protein [Aquabacter sp. P-9]MDE1571219.1 cryptochrome/photolyase family protein [Aquabacter sp. P-9]